MSSPQVAATKTGRRPSGRLVLDAHFLASNLKTAPAVALSAQRAGFEALWTTEGQYDAYLPLAAVIPSTEEIKLGTAVALAFTRSPMVTAYLAWALQKGSGGRFLLGLGSQVRAHLERRFSVEGDHPVERIVETINALRAIWDHWQNGSPLAFQGSYYSFTLMIPFMNPGPIEHPEIPIYLGAIGPLMSEAAGLAADGIMMHALHSPKYIRETVIPRLEKGAAIAGRDPGQITRALNVVIATGETPEEMTESTAEARRFISFYSATKAYRPVLEAHGWGELGDRMRVMAREQRWKEMPALISDEVLHTIGVVGAPEEIRPKLEERYRGLAERIVIYNPYSAAQEGLWAKVIAAE